MDGNITSLNFAPVQRSALPTTRSAGEPMVTVREQGTISLNSAACRLLGVEIKEGKKVANRGFIQVAPVGDNGARAILVALGDGPKGTDEKDLFKFSKGKKATQMQTSAAGLFSTQTSYQYRPSGSQNFKAEAVTLDANYAPNPKGKNVGIVFTVPSGSLTPPPKRTRQSKTNGTAQGSAQAPEQAPQPSMATE